MSSIKILAPHVASCIAAGEVIERPFSVCKELLENSIDAQAARINVDLVQGGKTCLTVEDDGKGIEYGELPLAIARHATSKISAIEDLEKINTLGYRGEALCSIAAVSRIEIRSRATGADSGGIIQAEAGEILLHTQTSCAFGTRVQVSDIFFNLMARLKFLRQAAAETKKITQIVQEYALMYPHIAFFVTSDGRKILSLQGSSTTEEVIKYLWEAEELKSIDVNKGQVRARLWWTGPSEAKNKLVTFVNRRRVQDATIKSALMQAAGAIGGAWLVMIDMPTEEVDVNVHPTKMEVRFRRSSEVFEAVRNGVLAVIEGQLFPRAPYTSNFPNYSNANINHTNNSQNLQNFEPRYETKISNYDGTLTLFGADFAQGGVRATHTYMGQSEKGFLFFDSPQGILALDPHAAHERILFERLRASVGDIDADKIFDAIPEDIRRDLEKKFPTMACKDAVKLTDKLQKEEALNIMEELMKCKVPSSCPHGRPTWVLVSWEEFSSRFKRS